MSYSQVETLQKLTVKEMARWDLDILQHAQVSSVRKSWTLILSLQYAQVGSVRKSWTLYLKYAQVQTF